jgi:hypothetical protein
MVPVGAVENEGVERAIALEGPMGLDPTALHKQLTTPEAYGKQQV